MRRVASILTMMTLLALTSAGCSTKRDPEKNGSVPGPLLRGVELETVKTVAIPETLEVVGTVRARTSAVVSSRIAGTISSLSVQEGDRIRKGQVLAQLDAREHAATAAVALAGIDEARQGLDEAMSRKRLADTTFERYHKLFNEHAVTRQEFDIKQTEKELAELGVSRAEARLQQARDGARAASTIADYTRVIAPISGVITAKPVNLGATVFPAQPLLTIEDEGSYQLELAIPESLVTKVNPGTSVQVMLDALNMNFNARITEVVPSTDSASRIFIAKVALGQKGLKSGMFGRGTIKIGTSVNSLLVPKKAVVERGALTSVWVADKANIARMRLVKVGKSAGERVEVLSGLSDGERVVVNGVEKVVEGAKIE